MRIGYEVEHGVFDVTSESTAWPAPITPPAPGMTVAISTDRFSLDQADRYTRQLTQLPGVSTVWTVPRGFLERAGTGLFPRADACPQLYGEESRQHRQDHVRTAAGLLVVHRSMNAVVDGEGTPFDFFDTPDFLRDVGVAVEEGIPVVMAGSLPPMAVGLVPNTSGGVMELRLDPEEDNRRRLASMVQRLKDLGE